MTQYTSHWQSHLGLSFLPLIPRCAWADSSSSNTTVQETLSRLSQAWHQEQKTPHVKSWSACILKTAANNGPDSSLRAYKESAELTHPHVTVPGPPVWRAEDWGEERVRASGLLVLRETVGLKWKMILPLPQGEGEGTPVTKTSESKAAREQLRLGPACRTLSGECMHALVRCLPRQGTGWFVPVPIWVGDRKRDSRRERGGRLHFHCLVAKMSELTVGQVSTTESSQVLGILLCPQWWPPGKGSPVTRSCGVLAPANGRWEKWSESWISWSGNCGVDRSYRALWRTHPRTTQQRLQGRDGI